MSQRQLDHRHKIQEFSKLRESLHEIIFEADTKEGKLFDVALLVIIVASVITVMLETVPGIGESHKSLFLVLEWGFTIFFTIEYVLRLYCVYRPMKYATSFFGVIDLLAILPTFISLFVQGTQSLVVVRALRLLRVFRIFKLANFMTESQVLIRALASSRAKISIFLFFIILLVCIFGSIMYLVEGGENPGFDSIPRSIYWAIVTMSTVGYGDISPQTPFGQFLSAIIMVLSYAIIAVPTGIVSAEAIKQIKDVEEITNTQVCRYCTSENHQDDATYCRICGEALK